MTKHDITPELLDVWISEMRELFKDDPNSMNLIAMCIVGLDTPNVTEEDAAKYTKRLKEFYENDLANSNDLECEHCGNKMEVYYTVHCFHCETAKPKIDESNQGNLFMAMKYVENAEEDFSSDDFWTDLVTSECIQGNDTVCTLPYLHENENIKLFKKHYNIKDTTWEVSW